MGVDKLFSLVISAKFQLSLERDSNICGRTQCFKKISDFSNFERFIDSVRTQNMLNVFNIFGSTHRLNVI